MCHTIIPSNKQKQTNEQIFATKSEEDKPKRKTTGSLKNDKMAFMINT